MKGLICFVLLNSFLINDARSNPLDLSPNYFFGSIRNVTIGATTYLTDTIQKQKDIIQQATNTATNYVSKAVAGPKKMLIDVKNATTKYIASTASKNMELKIKSLIEIFRVQMPYGMPALNLPVLEPLFIENLEVSTNNEDIGNIAGVVDNVTISKLSTFFVDDVKLNVIDEVSLAINFSVPEILVNGTYQMSGSIGKIFAVNGTGPFTVELHGGHLYVHTVLGYSGTVYAKSVDIDFSVDSAVAFFHRLFPDDEVNGQMNKVVSDLVPEILERIKPDLKPTLEDFFAQQVNASVSRLTMGNLIGILTGTVDLNAVPTLKSIQV